MSDLVNIRKRLESAFETDDGTSHRPPECPATDAYDILHDPEEPERPVKGRLQTSGTSLSLWIAGASFLLSALALSMESREVTDMIAGALMAFAATFGLYEILRRERNKRQSKSLRRSDEDQADREWAMREKQGLLSSIHDGLGDLAVVRDRKGRIVEANTVFRVLTGEPDPVGLSCEALGFRFETRQEQGRLIARLRRDGDERVFIWGDVVVRDPETGILRTESVARDITPESRMAAHAEEARFKAEQASAAKSRLLATVAHEIRTPLTGLLGMADLLGNSRLAADQRNYVAGLRQSGQVLSHLVEDLLDFATMEAGRFELRPVAESPRRLIEGIVEMLAPRAHFKGLEIASFIAPDVPEYLDFDPGRLRQVLFNVAGNAVKFTQTGGVSVTAVIEKADLVIRIADTGPGMTADERERIFEEFVQVGSARSRSAGKGLGLSISARIVEAFGGSMVVDSLKGEGSTFTIRIPVCESGRSQPLRHGLATGSAVILVAPDGPASVLIRRTIIALGGKCVLLDSQAALLAALQPSGSESLPWTDIVVDHRLERLFIGAVAKRAEQLRMRRIFLVNPEERQSRISGPYDAWLIRPLREQSLIDVLKGRLRGLEKRGATNDNLPLAKMEQDLPETGACILLGEDDPVSALLVQTTLERAGYSVRHASDFETLVRFADGSDGWRPDLVLTDLNMPGGHGMDVLGLLSRKSLSLRDDGTAVIVLTGESGEDMRQRALSSGADRVIAKPVSPGDLLAEVRSLLQDHRDLREG